MLRSGGSLRNSKAEGEICCAVGLRHFLWGGRLDIGQLHAFHLNATSTHVCSFAPFQRAVILANPSNAAERRP
jgi:hypothetical protein